MNVGPERPAALEVRVGFVVVCAVAFLVGISATIHFCRSMCCEMQMPGGWSMSMMWMRMHGQTWSGAASGFLFMWLAMMVAMMMPSALPTFLRTRRQSAFLCSMAAGYFAIWLAAGPGIYALGVAFAKLAMRSESFSRAVPVLSAALLFAAGATQFTRWKMRHLLRCRSFFGCATSCLRRETGFAFGCKQGTACCLCCVAPMTVQLVLGIMNPLAMFIVASVIAAEKLLPRPAIVARAVGGCAIVAAVLRYCSSAVGS